MMKLLAVDTATEACSVALLQDDEVLQRSEIAPREHSHLVLPMLESVLDEAGLQLSQLDALAFGRGPGSFMGIRIAAGVIQGIAFAQQLPVVPVSTLKAMAYGACHEHKVDKVITAIDARMQEVYWAAFSRDGDNGLIELVEECVTPPANVQMPQGSGWTGVGTGWGSYAETLQGIAGDALQQQFAELYPTASSIARLAAIEFDAGRTVSAAEAVPVYLRDNVAARPKNPSALV